MKNMLGLNLLVALLYTGFFCSGVGANPLPDGLNAQTTASFTSGYLKPSEIVALFPMSEEAEAGIIHVIPQCPVTIEGVVINPEDLARFNGQRLHFVLDKTGSLHAYLDVEEMERFVEAEYGPVFEQATEGIGLALDISELFEDWYCSGNKLNVEPGREHSQLWEWDNRISSTKINSSVPLTFWDYEFFGGDDFTMLPGSTHSALVFEGWNDRASSIS
jgi:hypothetical protein